MKIPFCKCGISKCSIEYTALPINYYLKLLLQVDITNALTIVAATIE